MNKKTTKKHSAVPTSQGISGFAILEQGLRITYVIIKIVIAVFVPKGQRIYDPGIIF